MKRLLFVFVILLVSIPSLAFEHYPMVSTSQTGGRYEIIMSPVGTWGIYKLDKYTGHVYKTDSYKKENGIGTGEWIAFDIQGLEDDIRKDNTINYQLIISGIEIYGCYLLNIHTGKSWRLEDSWNFRPISDKEIKD